MSLCSEMLQKYQLNSVCLFADVVVIVCLFLFCFLFVCLFVCFFLFLGGGGYLPNSPQYNSPRP